LVFHRIYREGGVKHNFPFGNVHPPDLKTPPHTIDLYSRARADGPLVLWKRAIQVVSLNTFECIGRWIKSGHYVINHKGDVVVVHCGNTTDGHVSIQFMDSEAMPCSVARSTIEPMLLGKVVVSEEQQSAVFEGKLLSNFFEDEAMLTNKSAQRQKRDGRISL
jgi:hypothetical protein